MITATPEATPVTTPVVRLIVAILGMPLVQVPPAGVPDKAPELPVHIIDGPLTVCALPWKDSKVTNNARSAGYIFLMNLIFNG